MCMLFINSSIRHHHGKATWIKHSTLSEISCIKSISYWSSGQHNAWSFALIVWGNALSKCSLQKVSCRLHNITYEEAYTEAEIHSSLLCKLISAEFMHCVCSLSQHISLFKIYSPSMSQSHIARKRSSQELLQQIFRCWRKVLLKKTHELSFICDADVYVLIYHCTRYYTYKSTEHPGWPLSEDEVVS